MAETITVTVPELPALVGSDTDDLLAVWRGDGLGRVPRSTIRGTRVFSGPSDPPSAPSTIVGLNPALDDRWRNTLTGDEWKVTSLDPFTWSPDGNVVGPAGVAGASTPGPAGPKGTKGDKGEDGRYEIYTAAEPVVAQTSVVDLGNGLCAPIDPNNDAHRGRLAGFATNDADTSGQVLVLKLGPFLGVSASLPADADLFIADGTGNTLLGGLTNVPPASGWRQIVGRMTGPTSLMYQPGEPSIIQDGDALVLGEGGFAWACEIDKGAQPGVTDRYVTPAANAIALASALASADLSANDVTPAGGTVATSVGDLFGRALTVLDFGAVADAVEVAVVEGDVTVGYTVTGFDNTAAFNAAGTWARANGRPVIVPPGRYKASSGTVEWGDVNVYGAGAQIYVPNSAASSGTPPKYKIVFSTAQADIEPLDLAAIKNPTTGWKGWTRRSRKLTNLTDRAGQYICVSTPWQYLLKRNTGDANKEVLFGEGFRVLDDTGRLAHTLFGNAKMADWKTDGRTNYEGPYYEARKCKSVVTVEGLKITTYRDGNFATSAANACDAIVSVQRSFTTLRDVWLENISGRQVLQGFNVDRCCDIRFYSCHVDGLQQSQTNYGWNIGTCAGIELYGCSQRFCRRGVDAHRGKHIKIIGGDYPDGLGAHYAWWMGAIGANIGPAGGSNNAQVFAVSGGGCYLRSCEIVCGPSTDAVARVRDDLFECGDVLAIEDCSIVLQDGSGTSDDVFFIMDLTGPPNGYNYNVTATTGMTAETRTIELPRQISIRGNTIEDLDTTGRAVRPVHILKDYTSANFPAPIDVNMSLHISDNAWKRALPNNTLPDGSPWLQIYYYKTPTMVGRGVQAFIADMLTCYFWTYSSANPATSDGRIDVEFSRIPGRVDVRYGIGSYRRIRANVQDFRPSVIAASAAFSPNGDEAIVSGGISGGGVNYPIAKVAASGETVKYGATGVSDNIPVLYRAEGTSPAILADAGQRVGFYGSSGAFKQTLIASPTADVNALKAAFDDLRAKLIATGLLS